MLDALDQSRQQAVFDRMRAGILAGTLGAGSRLPPTRALAAELGVARQTVVSAYERLAAEGYVQARIGAGTFVAALPDRPGPAPVRVPDRPALSGRGTVLAGLPMRAVGGSLLLAPGIPAPELFPARAWASCAGPVPGGYPDPQGLLALRLEVAAHLATTRGLLTDPDCILITAGTQQALRLMAELLLDPGDRVWVEEPGYIAGRAAVLAAGGEPVPVPSDGAGLDVAAGIAAAPTARMVLLAPSHSTPRGAALPIGRRLALLDWADGAGAWVLEDDCDAEFRWQGKPLPPLATLSRHGRVIYCGTFSKTLSPSLRLGFAVLPHALMVAAVSARAATDRGPGTPVQVAAAEFMRRGLLPAHVRRARVQYGLRRDAVLDALARHCPAAEPLDAPGGLHMIVRLHAGDEAKVVHSARAAGLGVAPLLPYFVGKPGFPGLVIGFAATPQALAADVAKRLAGAVRRASATE